MEASRAHSLVPSSVDGELEEEEIMSAPKDIDGLLDVFEDTETQCVISTSTIGIPIDCRQGH